MKARNSSAAAPTRRIDGLRVIALFKFGKALLVLLTTYGLRQLLKPQIIERLNTWTLNLTDAFPRRMLIRALDWLDDLGTARLNLVIGVSLGYFVLVMFEGLGLWFRKVWGEWLTIVATASLIPFELWELIGRHGNRKAGALLALALNLIIVGYLAAQLEKSAKARRGRA